MSGVELRLGRLFDAGTGRAYIVAIDHGLSLGVQPGAEDAVGAVERAMAGEPDGVKTEYTGSPATMRTVVDGCPAPVLVLGGARMDSPDALYDMTRDALGAGAAGVVYGRNIWQADDPAKVGAAVRAIVHGSG